MFLLPNIGKYIKPTSKLIREQFNSHNCWEAKVRENDWQRVWRGSKGRVDFGTVRRKGSVFQGEEIEPSKNSKNGIDSIREYISPEIEVFCHQMFCELVFFLAT